MSSRVAQTHVHKNKPINFLFTKSTKDSDLNPIHCQTCAFFIWKNKPFIDAYKKILEIFGKFESYGLSTQELIDIDTEETFLSLRVFY